MIHSREDSLYLRHLIIAHCQYPRETFLIKWIFSSSHAEYITSFENKAAEHRRPKREMRGNNLCKWNVRERDSCLQAVLCYKDAIYKGLYGNFTGLL